MIPTLGHGALIAALIVSAALPVWRKPWLATALFILLSFSFAALTQAYVTSDFSVLNVAENSHTLKPLIYKISGVWGNHEGSILLWVWMLALWGFLAARARAVPATMKRRVLAVQGMLSFGFLLFILLTSNPFRRLDPPAAEGLDLNPLLQDIGLAIHPPLLYAGYVGFSIAFCFAMAALAERKVDALWARRVRPWVLAAWIALTLGIASGAVWAYYELGWGGFWFWDPVENASLMPWLAGTALLHSIAVLEKRGALANWTIFLSILSFSLSLLGTFLVRSGILTSVHAFANDPARGIFILLLLTVSIGGGFLYYALRAPQVKQEAAFQRVSRETALLLNNVFLFAFCMTVMTGTLYPVFLSALDLGSVSVGPPYYTLTLLPMLVPFAFLTGAAPLIAWRQGNAQKLSIPLIMTAMMLGVLATLPLRDKIFSLLGFGMGGWVLAATLYDFAKKIKQKIPRSYFGMTLAHAGFGLLIIGVTATTLWKEEHILWMQPGDRLEMAGRSIAFLGTHESTGPNYARKVGIFTIDGEYMTPEKRWYPAQQKMTSEVALKPHKTGMIYLVMGDPDKDRPERWTVRAYFHPLALWMLAGALLIAAGGVLALTGKRHE